MGLNIFSVFLVFWVSAIIAKPLNSHYLPKEYYQRQNLPDIPGYIPVYIKHDDEPLPKWKGSEVVAQDKPDENSFKAEDGPVQETVSSVQQQSVKEESKQDKLTEKLKNSETKNNKN